jgi:predicted small secreted protein
MSRQPFVISALMALALTSGCETANQAGNEVKSVGQTVAGAAGDAAKGAVSLVNVNLSNVLNDLALDLKIDKANIPINAQIPITLAANVCGVSINILSVSTGGSPNCTAHTTSPDLAQAVQQQLAANGSVGGGNQSAQGATGATGTSGTTAAATPSPTPSPSPAGTNSTGTQQQTPAQ